MQKKIKKIQPLPNKNLLSPPDKKRNQLASVFPEDVYWKKTVKKKKKIILEKWIW